MNDNLRIGVPSKGRLAEVAEVLLKEAGLSFRRPERTLFARCKEIPVDITFLRTDDIPVLCAEGAIDMGITGGDLVAEAGAEVIKRLELGVGNCRLAVCVPEERQRQSAEGFERLRIATSFPNVTRKYLQAARGRGTSGHAHRLRRDHDRAGRGRRDCRPGRNRQHAGGQSVADSRRNRPYETVLIQNSAKRHAELADRVVRRLEGVVIARSYSLLEYNVPRSKLPEAEKITPGFNSPTVNALEDPAWCAVQVMVRRSEVIGIMERLEALGASAILETEITNCRL